jgi:hypothetical protein
MVNYINPDITVQSNLYNMSTAVLNLKVKFWFADEMRKQRLFLLLMLSVRNATRLDSHGKCDIQSSDILLFWRIQELGVSLKV